MYIQLSHGTNQRLSTLSMSIDMYILAVINLTKQMLLKENLSCVSDLFLLILLFSCIARQRSKSASEVFLHSAVVVSPLFQRRKLSNIGASCSSSTSLSSSSSATVSATRRCPVCRSPFLPSQISYLYGESLARSKEASSSHRLSLANTKTPGGTPTSKTKRREISERLITTHGSMAPSSSYDPHQTDNDALRVRDACSPSTPQSAEFATSYHGSPHRERLRSEEGEEQSGEEKKVSYTRESKEEEEEDYAPRSKDVSRDGLLRRKNSEHMKKHGEKEEEDLKASCSSTGVRGTVRDEEREEQPQAPPYRVRRRSADPRDRLKERDVPLSPSSKENGSCHVPGVCMFKP